MSRKFVGKAINPDLYDQFEKGVQSSKQKSNAGELFIPLSEIKPDPNNPRDVFTFTDNIVNQLFKLGTSGASPIHFIFTEDGETEVTLSAEEWDLKGKDLKFINNIRRLGIAAPSFDDIKVELAALLKMEGVNVGPNKQEEDYKYLVSLASSIFVHGLNNAIKVSEVDGGYQVENGTRRRLASMIIRANKVKSIVMDKSVFKTPLDAYLHKVTDNNHGQGFTLADSFKQIERVTEYYQDIYSKKPTIETLSKLLEMPKLKVRYILSLMKTDSDKKQFIIDALFDERVKDYNLLSNIEKLGEYIAINPASIVNRKDIDAAKSKSIAKPNPSKKGVGRQKESISLQIKDLEKARRAVSVLADEFDIDIGAELNHMDFTELQSILKMIK